MSLSAERQALVVPAFRIAVPEDWDVFDPAFLADPGRLEQFVDDDLSTAAREELVQVVAATMAVVRDDGVRFAAVRHAGEGDQPPMAALAVSVAALGGHANGQTVDEIDVVLRGRPEAPRVTDEQNDAGVEWLSTESVRLSCGEAVRTVGVVAYGGNGVGAVEVFAVRYVLGIEDAGVALSLTAISPASGDLEERAALFDEIASTLDVDPVA